MRQTSLDCLALEIAVAELTGPALVVGATLGHCPAASIEAERRFIAFGIEGAAAWIATLVLFAQNDCPAFVVLEAASFVVTEAVGPTELAVYAFGVEQTTVAGPDVRGRVVEIVTVDIAAREGQEGDQSLADHRAHIEC